ncbi:MAG: hypothetical protein PF484_00530 [Bacteroidales bacterium]|jgi:hypothetical protein|nr:hypothetical protein [Bacteroidales bacterium]
MKIKFLIVTCTLLCLLNIFLLFRISEINIDTEVLTTKYQNYILDLQLGDIDVGDETLSCNIFKDTKPESIIIYRIFGERCNKCIVDGLSMLREAEKKYGVKVLVLFPEPGNRQENILNINMLEDLNFKYVSQKEFICENINSKNGSFYAILKNEGIITNIFFPDSKLPALLDAYFNNAVVILE